MVAQSVGASGEMLTCAAASAMAWPQFIGGTKRTVERHDFSERMMRRFQACRQVCVQIALEPATGHDEHRTAGGAGIGGSG